MKRISLKSIRGFGTGYIILFCVVLLFIFVSVVRFSLKDDSYEVRNKYYTSVSVSSGDTLWSIASEYCDEDVEVEDYIEELKFINNIPDGNIRSGSHLIISYYETAN